MRDGAAERRLRRGLAVDVDPLVIVGEVGEAVDHVLVDQAPVRHADLLTDAGFEAFRCVHAVTLGLDGVKECSRVAAGCQASSTERSAAISASGWSTMMW